MTKDIGRYLQQVMAMRASVGLDNVFATRRIRRSKSQLLLAFSNAEAVWHSAERDLAGANSAQSAEDALVPTTHKAADEIQCAVVRGKRCLRKEFIDAPVIDKMITTAAKSTMIADMQSASFSRWMPLVGRTSRSRHIGTSATPSE